MPLSIKNPRTVQPRQCLKCDKVLKTKASLDSHSTKCRLEECCTYCGKRLSSKNMKRHINEIHRQIKYTCDICENTFAQRSTMESHKRSIHSDHTYSCVTCQLIFDHKPNLIRHQRSHTGVQIPCTLCDYSNHRADSVKRHMERIHKK